MEPTQRAVPGDGLVRSASAGTADRRVHARWSTGCARRSREKSRSDPRPLAGAGARRGVACPETSLGDLEDEVMCPVCGTSLGLATEAPQAQRERAFIQRLIDRVQVEGRDQGRARRRVRRRGARLPDDDGFEIAAYLIPAAILLGAAAAIAVGVQPLARRARRPRRRRRPRVRPNRSGSTRIWRSTTCDPARSRQRRHHGLRRLRRRLRLVHLAVRAAARARLPVGDLRARVRRDRGGQVALEGPPPRDHLLPLVHARCSWRSA